MALPAEGGAVVRLSWPDDEGRDPGALAAEAIKAGASRVEVVIAPEDPRRRLLHRAGFRREGTLRSSLLRPDGSYGDASLYSFVAGDLSDAAETFSTVMNSVLPRKRLIAHAVFRDEGGRVLLLEVSYKSDWELPGGIVEPGEPPRIGCEREVSEEIGLEVGLSRVLCLDWLPPYLGWEDALEVIFDGGVLSPTDIAAMQLGEGEIVAAHWVEPGVVGDHVFPLAARRLEWLLENPGAPPTLFEDGRPVR